MIPRRRRIFVTRPSGVVAGIQWSGVDPPTPEELAVLEDLVDAAARMIREDQEALARWETDGGAPGPERRSISRFVK